LEFLGFVILLGEGEGCGFVLVSHKGLTPFPRKPPELSAEGLTPKNRVSPPPAPPVNILGLKGNWGGGYGPLSTPTRVFFLEVLSQSGAHLKDKP